MLSELGAEHLMGWRSAIKRALAHSEMNLRNDGIVYETVEVKTKAKVGPVGLKPIRELLHDLDLAIDLGN